LLQDTNNGGFVAKHLILNAELFFSEYVVRIIDFVGGRRLEENVRGCWIEDLYEVVRCKEIIDLIYTFRCPGSELENYFVESVCVNQDRRVDTCIPEKLLFLTKVTVPAPLGHFQAGLHCFGECSNDLAIEIRSPVVDDCVGTTTGPRDIGHQIFVAIGTKAESKYSHRIGTQPCLIYDILGVTHTSVRQQEDALL